MKFARLVFAGAGMWGMCVLAPLFFLVDISGRHYLPPTDYPQFFYGFLTVAFAWQVAFLVIAKDPVRFRPFILPAVACSSPSAPNPAERGPCRGR